MSDNELAALPATLSALGALQTLAVSGNALRRLPFADTRGGERQLARALLCLVAPALAQHS